MITTNGVPKIICDNIIPVCVAAKPTFAIKKNIAVPEIINGTIIGEINKAMNAALYGMYLLLKPNAATVPRMVDPMGIQQKQRTSVLTRWPPCWAMH